MKVIFLDIDGVLNSGDYLNALHIMRYKHEKKGYQNRDEYGQVFDPRCVAYLDHIISSTGAKLVISSTWRRAGLSLMQEMWQMRDLPGEVIDITPTTCDPELAEKYYDPGADRGYEIQEWIEKHPELEGYVILDDDSDMLNHQQFVQCNGRIGINYEVANTAIALLLVNIKDDASNK